MFAWEAPYKNLALHPGVGQSLSEKKVQQSAYSTKMPIADLADWLMVNLIGWNGPKPKKSGAMRSATYFKLSTFQKFKNFNRLFLDEKNGNGTDAILLLWLQALIFVILEKWNWIKKV